MPATLSEECPPGGVCLPFVVRTAEVTAGAAVAAVAVAVVIVVVTAVVGSRVVRILKVVVMKL